MARTVRDAKLENRTTRDKLKPRSEPYWRTLVPGKLHLGYRKRHKGKPGIWLVRRYKGLDSVGSNYTKKNIGPADDYEDADGERVLNFADAQAIAQQRKPRTAKGDDLTVADAIAAYVSWLKVHKATGAGVEQRAALHILPKLGSTKVVDLTTDQLNRWRDALAASPALLRTGMGRAQNRRDTPTTADERRDRKVSANKSVTILKGALNHAFNNDLVHDDKAWRKFKPFAKVDRANERFLSLEEAQRLINAADAESGFRDMVHAALLTGCRYGELCRLKVGDFEGGKVMVRTSKSGKPRSVRLTEEGKAFFAQLTAGRADEEIMLLNRRLGREWRKSEQGRPMRAACMHARIKPIGIHALRHTWASLSVMGGVPLLVVANNLGHADTRMVEKHYGHLTQSYMDEAIAEGAPRFNMVESGNVATFKTGQN